MSTDRDATRATLKRFWDRLDLSPEERERAQFSSRRYLPVLDFVARDPPRSEEPVLDLGGGIGSLAVALHARYGGIYHLADFQVPSAPRQAVLHDMGVERCFEVRLDRPNALAELPNDYQWIVFAEVLEHLLTNPLTLFHEMYDHLRTDGRLLITTPNQARASNRVKLVLGRSIKEKDRFPTDGSPGYGHVMEYTLDELESLLGWEAFRVERSTIIQNLPTIRTTRGQQTLVRFLNTPLAGNLRLGDDIILVARKRPRTSNTAPRPSRV
jgi:2-polyprenyl-3-methyl-5-hydroxy-6-metoxy-1,4-benzoquinol methylase